MRRLITSFVSTLVVAVAVPFVALASGAECTQGLGGSAITCAGDYATMVSTSQSIQSNTTGNSSTSSGPAKKYVPYNRLTTGPDGQPCATTGYVEEGTTPPDERLLADPNPRESNIPITGNDQRILETYPPCPSQPLAPGEPAPVETAAMIAARYWETVPLPKPRPAIAPGRAITGKLAYLETKGEIGHAYTNATVLGSLEITAKGSYAVDWGDGTTTGPHAFEGSPWPDGRITHDYLRVGSYDVVVTERWTATWRLGSESGTLRTLQTTGRINAFPVEQIQAVIGR